MPFLRCKPYLLALAVSLLSTPAAWSIDSPDTVPAAAWMNLRSPLYIWPADGAIYYSFKTPQGVNAHLIVVDTRSGKWRFRPYLNDATTPTSETAQKTKASAAVNGGYFNLTDGASASYVVVDGKEVANPRSNKALVENPKLAPYLERIFDRSEIRFLEDQHGQIVIRIATHSASIPEGLKLLHSLQAGPQLLPVLKGKEEAFVRPEGDGKEADPIASNRAAARTAFGITPEGYAMIICIAGNGQQPESSGIALPALADLLKHLGCSEAINLDGGSSTTMFVRSLGQTGGTPNGLPPGESVCGKSPETRVKSVLLLERSGR